jgi:hypothetical protein
VGQEFIPRSTKSLVMEVRLLVRRFQSQAMQFDIRTRYRLPQVAFTFSFVGTRTANDAMLPNAAYHIILKQWPDPGIPRMTWSDSSREASNYSATSSSFPAHSEIQ